MEKLGPNNEYHKYLTEKLDEGSPNIVVESVSSLIDRNFLSSKNLRIADLGCYTGSIINRVYNLLPDDLRNKTVLVGFDLDSEIINEASLTRPHISFFQQNLSEEIKKHEPFNILILSNILHEIYSPCLPDKNKAKSQVTKALSNVQKLTKPGGFIVLLDGILPDDSSKNIDIKFANTSGYDKFIKFNKSGYVINIPCKENDNLIITTTLVGLASFLSKSRYLDTSFWEQEAEQVYHYFSQEDFKESLLSYGFTITEQIFQKVDDVEKKLQILDTSIKIPYKNTLIVARQTR